MLKEREESPLCAKARAIKKGMLESKMSKQRYNVNEMLESKMSEPVELQQVQHDHTELSNSNKFSITQSEERQGKERFI